MVQAFCDNQLVIGSVDVGFGIFLRDSAGRARRKLPPATFAQVEEMVAGVLVPPQENRKFINVFGNLNYTLTPMDTVFGKEFNEVSPEEQPGEPRMTWRGDNSQRVEGRKPKK